MNLNMKGKVAIVTGAARGIGRTIALTFAKEGVAVVIGDIDLGAARLIEEEAKTVGAQSIAVRADVTKTDEVRRMVNGALSKFGRLDILVNNAGMLYTEGKPTVRKLFQESTEEDWPREINVTLYGVLNCTKVAIEPMLSQRSGSIINIVSEAGRTFGPRCTIYGAGKGGIIAFSKNLAYEVGPFGIRVNCVSPGVTRTTRFEAIESRDETSPEAVKYLQEMEVLAKQVPLRRIGTTQDIANAVVFLASDACNFITGQTLSVNGGLIMP